MTQLKRGDRKSMPELNRDGRKIVFFAHSHTYYEGERKVPSVGSVKSKYEREFEREYWLTHGALKECMGTAYSSKYSELRKKQGMMPLVEHLFEPIISNMTPDQLSDYVSARKSLADLWEFKRDKASYLGTELHDFKENKAYEDGYLLNPYDGEKYPVTKYDKDFDNESLTENLMDLPDGAYPELVVFDPEMRITGQADEVYIWTDPITNIRYVDVGDTKTALDGKNPKKSGPMFMHEPFDGIRDAKHNKYMLQINIYAYLLSLHGFEVRYMSYTFHSDYHPDRFEVIPLDNIQGLVHMAFQEEWS